VKICGVCVLVCHCACGVCGEGVCNVYVRGISVLLIFVGIVWVVCVCVCECVFVCVCEVCT